VLTPTGLPSPREIGMQEYQRLYREMRAKDPIFIVSKRESHRRWYQENRETPTFEASRRAQVARRRHSDTYREYQRRWKVENRRTQRRAQPSQRWYSEQTSPFIAAGLTIGDPRRMRPSDWREDAVQDRILADLEARATQRGKAA